MKILILSDGFPPVLTAGAENIAYITAKEYLSRGHSVTVITVNNELEKGTVRKVTHDNVDIIQIGAKYNERFIAYVSLYNFKILNIIKNLLNEDYDIAHIHNIHKYISYGVIGLLKDKNIKTILTAHDAMSIDYGKFIQGIDPFDLSSMPNINLKVNPFKTLLRYRTKYNPFRNIIIKYYLSKLDKIVTVSSALEELLNKNGISNTVTIHNGLPETLKSIDIKQFKNKYNITENNKILLWAGRISKAKGAKQVIKLMDRVIKKHKDIKLFIAGGKMDIPLHLANNIILSGWLTKEEMELAYEMVDITLVPSIYPDPFPTVILESLRVGTPVISTCFGGAKEAIEDGKSGYIINPFDIDNFYDKVIKLLDDTKLYESMNKKAIESFNDRLTIKTSIDKYMELVKGL